ncbi:gamma-glutamylcyclotransferase [Salmonella enterica subsp. enterica serovar Choleraesuis]|nr:gamma-glutamylcyclotransferase [Salmonella enterica subsp. enterica serovar Choleraesuis]
MLTRDFLISADCHSALGVIEDRLYWTEEQRAASLAATLAQRPAGEALWVFGYGSLMWNPAIEYAERATATLEGWHRAFCLHLTAGRGTPRKPGRMLALSQGGETQGVAYRLDEQTMSHELCLLWRREMITGCYIPSWCALTLEDGRQVHGLAFVMDSRHALYKADSSLDVVAPLIASAGGPLGSNADYLYSLEKELRSLGLDDPNLHGFSQRVRELQQLNCVEK